LVKLCLVPAAGHAHCISTKPVICSPNVAILIAYATHGNILHATIWSTNLPDNSGTEACSIFLYARKIWHAGCEVVKWAHDEANEADLAIFCTLKLLPVLYFYFQLCVPILQLTENQ